MDTTATLARFGLAFVIGILVGLQREYAGQRSQLGLFAGARTLALIGIAGCTAALLSDLAGTPWLFVASSLVVAALIGIAYFVSASRGDIGLTTEIAAFLVFLIGALCYWGPLEIAAALGVGVAVLLSLKLGVRRLVGRLSEQDEACRVNWHGLCFNNTQRLYPGPPDDLVSTAWVGAEKGAFGVGRSRKGGCSWQSESF